MRLATLSKGSDSCVAAINQDGNKLIDLQQAAKEAGFPTELFDDMIALLESGAEGRSLAGRLIDHGLAEGRGRDFRMEELLAPVPCPRKLFCLAGNYLEHIEEGGGVAAPQDKETPRIFMKPPSSTVVGPGAVSGENRRRSAATGPRARGRPGRRRVPPAHGRAGARPPRRGDASPAPHIIWQAGLSPALHGHRAEQALANASRGGWIHLASPSDLRPITVVIGRRSTDSLNSTGDRRVTPTTCKEC